MAKHFGAQHTRNGYAAMGGHRNRPIYSGVNTGRNVAEAIAAEKIKAARMKAASTKK